ETSDTTLDEMEVKAKYMYGLVEVPLELVKTGVGVEEKLNHLLATSLNKALEDSALNGKSNGFKGIFNDSDIATETIEKADYDGIKKGVKVNTGTNHR